MRSRINAFLRRFERTTDQAIDAPGEEHMRLGAAALLVETAIMDGHFDDAERKTIMRLIGARFALDVASTGALVDEAEQAVRSSSHLFPFTKAINDHFTPAQRVELMEMLWEVAYADGVIHDFEENLLRRIGGLIYVTDRDRGMTRNRVRARLGID